MYLGIRLIGYPLLTIASVFLIGIQEVVAGREESLKPALEILLIFYVVFSFSPYILYGTDLMIRDQLKKCREWMIKETRGEDKIDHTLLRLCGYVGLFC